MKVLELKGYKSLRAFQAYHTLLLGLKMLPSYATESYEGFYTRISEMPPLEQEKIIREAVLFVELTKEEVEAIICFCSDPNGIPYRSENIKNLTPDQLVEGIVSVCVEISKFKVSLITEDEKKNSVTSQST